MSEIEILRSALLAARASSIAATHALDGALAFLADGTPSTTDEAVETDSGGLSVESDEAQLCQHLDAVALDGMGVKVCPDCGANTPI